MSSCQSNSATSTAFAPARSEDPAWSHARVVPGARNSTQCLYCSKIIRGGGVTRLKYHLGGISGDVEACKKVPDDIKSQMKELVNEMKKNKEKKRKLSLEIGCGSPVDLTYDDVDVGDDEYEGGSQGPVHDSKGKGKEKVGGKSTGPFSRFFAPRTSPGSQPSIKSAMCSKEMIDKAKMAIANWWYDANLPFNASQSKFYQPAIDAIAAIGPGFKGPSLHELRGNLLKNSVTEVQNYLLDIKTSWRDSGCSLMADGWTNQRQQPIINFLVYCPKGTIFLKSIDTSGLRKDAETLFKIFDEVVQEVGVENIVQFITDNDASYKAAGKKLQQKYGSLFWSPCAAHCIDLMLENFCDPRHFPIIDETIKKARKITKFIYNHAWVLALMRKDFTKGHDLCRPAVTRFATNFLSIQCLLLFKKELRQMFTCDKWIVSSYSKSNIGKEIAEIVLEDREFWAQCQFIVTISEPLVRVLRLVDGDEKPAMGYLYNAMEKAKENIKARLKNKVSAFMPFIRVIDARWDKQLHSPLHAAGCLLNPGIYFNPCFKSRNDVSRGFTTCVVKMEPDIDKQDEIIQQIDMYKNANGDFGQPIAIRQREKSNPVAWWSTFGNEFPALQTFAIRILSQCCSATGCERNWSTFEFIHSKKRNRLEHKRLNDLVFVRYNLKLRERNIKRGRDALDPINLENIDLMEEWVGEESELIDGEDLDWGSIEEPLASQNLEEGVNVGLDIDDDGGDNDIDENILSSFANVDPFCLIDENE
ncbi:uncharacterized protein LOC122316382 [Carya illinoinensis]|uniref:BED-type domain-containing protein n=1 Tax=Carya illinoinensis TaxID=32201 RepID=A0A8T1Q2I3_CARIL|nr:uncharacterized protein LOC122316382 [Carya illinoinensis]KAG6648808.1 hypothetical protein CIPAW_07G170200 [Carya illinoinensis]